MEKSKKKKNYSQEELQDLISKYVRATFYEDNKPFTTFFIVEPKKSKYYMIEGEYKSSLQSATYTQPIRVVKVMREEWEAVEDDY